jgi:hypothetical protein
VSAQDEWVSDDLLLSLIRCVVTALKHPPVDVDVRYAPQSDQLLRCRKMTQWAKSDESAAQQNAAIR